MPFGPFTLQWRAPTPNPPAGSPLPAGITRSYIQTPSGPLELLTALPPPSIPSSHSQSSLPSKPPLFFAHGGFGCAQVWLSYLQYFASHGYPCYAVSYRGHGNSWYPGFWSMYFTSRDVIAGDLVEGIREVERVELERRKQLGKEQEKVRVVLIAHSAGGALSQYVLSKGLVKVDGFCLLAGVPGFGSFSCYNFWALTAPIHFSYRLFHPRYVLANTRQVYDAFFTTSTPTSVVQTLERILSPYESMLWPMQALFRFVTGPDVISSITGWTRTSSAGPARVGPRFLVLAAEHDVLCTPEILRDAAERYRKGLGEAVRMGKIDGIGEEDLGGNDEGRGDGSGISFRVVKGLGHHLQNHIEWGRGADEILEWVEEL